MSTKDLETACAAMWDREYERLRVLLEGTAEDDRIRQSATEFNAN